eukprot:5527266-Karenia_brevis.AAC.1
MAADRDQLLRSNLCSVDVEKGSGCEEERQAVVNRMVAEWDQLQRGDVSLMLFSVRRKGAGGGQLHGC